LKDLSGNFLSGVGETLVSVEKPVRNDFQVKCFQSGNIDVQVGRTICLHTAFIQNNFERVKISQSLNLDLIFHESYQKQQRKPVSKDESNSSDSCPEQCPRDCEREESKNFEDAADNKNKFWLTLSQNVLHV